MKKLFIIIVVFSAALNSSAQFSSATLTASGLTCAMCTKAIYNSLQTVSFVKSVDADIKNSSFIIEFKSGADVDPDQLKSAVEEAGFSVSKLTLTGKFEKLKIGKDEHLVIGTRTFHFLQPSQTELMGNHTITLVDKHFLSAKAFKKYAAASSMLCVETGRMEKCCVKGVKEAPERIYHVTI